MIDRGIPDWRDPTAYPNPDELSDRQWWWEFTRRRPDYREAWNSPHNSWADDRDNHRFPQDAHDLALRFNMRSLFNPAKRYSSLDLMICYEPPNTRAGPATRLRHSALGHAKALIENVGEDVLSREIELERTRAEKAELAGYTLYQFDLSKPLPPQLKTAKEYLSRRQKERYGVVVRSPNKEMWPLYLRVLDARTPWEGCAPASWKTVAETIWPHASNSISRARGVHRWAERIRDDFPL